MENLITDECIETSEEKMLFHRLLVFLYQMMNNMK